MSDSNQSNDRFKGRVKWFNPTRGFGFITNIDSNNEDDDVFVHHSSLSVPEGVYKTLSLGEFVEFEVVTDDNGKKCSSNITGSKSYLRPPKI